MDVASRRVVNALKTAIRREERTSAAYTSKAKKTRNPEAKKVLETLAKQEIGHANKLLKMLNKGADLSTLGKKGRELAGGLQVINDDVRAIEKSTEVVKVLRKAAKAEENSGRLYRSMEKIYKGFDVADLSQSSLRKRTSTRIGSKRCLPGCRPLDAPYGGCPCDTPADTLGSIRPFPTGRLRPGGSEAFPCPRVQDGRIQAGGHGQAEKTPIEAENVPEDRKRRLKRRLSGGWQATASRVHAGHPGIRRRPPGRC